MIDELPFDVSASTSFLVLHAEEIGETWVEVLALFDDGHESRVRLTFKRCIEARLAGYSGQGIGLVENSPLLNAVIAKQSASFPGAKHGFENMKHYVIGGHDKHADVVAESFTWHEVKHAG